MPGQSLQPTNMRPIFVGGCGRSGTTVLAAELGKRLGLTVPPEAQFLVRGLAAANGAGSERVSRFSATALSDWRITLWFDEAARLALPDRLKQVNSPREAMVELARAYSQPKDGASPQGWVDHTPWNVVYARTLLDEFEESPLIHIVRDPRAVIASVLPLDWGPSTARDGARWWMERVGAGLLAEAAEPARVYRVSYEAMVLDPDAQFAALLDWLRTEFGFTATNGDDDRPAAMVPKYTSSQHALVGQPLDPRRVEGWRDRLSSRDVSTIEGELGDALPLLGYPPVSGTPALRQPKSVGEVLASVYRPLLGRARASRRRRAS